MLNSGNNYKLQEVKDFCYNYTKTLSESTKRAYMKDIKDFFGVVDLTSITIEQIRNVNLTTSQEFKQRLEDEGKSTSTINRKLTALSNFYRYLCRRDVGIMEYNPFLSEEGTVRMYQDKRYSNTRCLTVDEVKRLLKAIENDDAILQLRNTIIVLALATTGMRRAELTHIRIGDIKIQDCKDVIELTQGTKGRKSRYVVVSDSLKVMIDKYIAMRGLDYTHKNVYLLANHAHNNFIHTNDILTESTIYRVIKSIADKAGIDASSISPNCLRNTFITRSRELGLDIQDIADMVGHTSISTTQRYFQTNRVISNSPADMLSDMFLGDNLNHSKKQT